VGVEATAASHFMDAPHEYRLLSGVGLSSQHRSRREGCRTFQQLRSSSSGRCARRGSAGCFERLNNSESPDDDTHCEYRSEFVRVLKQEKLALDRIGASCTGIQLAALLKETYNDWNQQLFSGLLWTSLFNGTAEDRVVDGWLIESYHFIRGANARLSYAAAQASDERIREIFARHSVEEYNHHEFFAESLRRRGFDPVIVDRVGPLPTTRAVIEMARFAARVDCLAYAACSGLLESTGSDVEKGRAFYYAVGQHFDADKTDFVAPMLKHLELDEAYGHGSVMQDVF
jgi:hypothetical protein